MHIRRCAQTPFILPDWKQRDQEDNPLPLVPCVQHPNATLSSMHPPFWLPGLIQGPQGVWPVGTRYHEPESHAQNHARPCVPPRGLIFPAPHSALAPVPDEVTVAMGTRGWDTVSVDLITFGFRFRPEMEMHTLPGGWWNVNRPKLWCGGRLVTSDQKPKWKSSLYPRRPRGSHQPCVVTKALKGGESKLGGATFQNYQLQRLNTGRMETVSIVFTLYAAITF